jgi:ATP-binding cassette subfamily B protein
VSERIGQDDEGGVAAVLWPVQRLGEALEELARRSGLRLVAGETTRVPASLAADGLQEQGRWIEWAAQRFGLEAEALDTVAPELESLLQGAAPALLRIERDGEAGFLLLLKSSATQVRLVGPDLRVHRHSIAQIRTALCTPYEAPFAKEVDGLLAAAAVRPERVAAVRSALLRDRLGEQPVASCWLLRLSPARGFWEQLAQEGLRQRIFPIVAVFAALYGMEVLAWSLIGETTIHGRVDRGWLTAWVLLVLSLVPLQMLGSWLDARFALDTGRILKSRLLAGALRSDVETVRRQGAGELLGRVMESQALEALALDGGFGVLVGLLELVFAASILAAGAGGAVHVLLLAGWTALMLALSWRYLGRLRAWTLERLRMTHDLVERMVGHRTRLAQEQPQRRDHEEDRELGSYLHTSTAMDRAILPIVGAMPRGWMFVALAGLAPAFITGRAQPADVAIALGGMLLAGRALGSVSNGMSAVGRAAVAWSQVAAFFRAGEKEAVGRQPFLPAATPDHAQAGGALIDARDLSFRYTAKGRPVLAGVDLSIARGDRILLEDARRQLAQARRRSAAVPREPHPERHARLQPADGTQLAGLGRGPRRSAHPVRRTGAGRIAGTHAFRPGADRRRNRLAALAWRAQPHLPGPGAAAEGAAHGARRKLRGARPRHAGQVPALRLRTRADADGDRASVNAREERAE